MNIIEYPERCPYENIRKQFDNCRDCYRSHLMDNAFEFVGPDKCWKANCYEVIKEG